MKLSIFKSMNTCFAKYVLAGMLIWFVMAMFVEVGSQLAKTSKESAETIISAIIKAQQQEQLNHEQIIKRLDILINSVTNNPPNKL